MKDLKIIFTTALVVALLGGCAQQPTPQPAESTTAAETTVTTTTETKSEPSTNAPINVVSLKGPTGMGMVNLMETSEEGLYDFTLSSAPDELVGKIVTGEFDIACVPTNLAAALYNKTKGKVQIAAVNTLGVLYLLENGETIKDITDLKGKTVYVSGKGASPDFVFRYLLQEAGLDPENDVDINFSLNHADLAAAVAAKKVDIALLPQPHATIAMMKGDNLNTALDLNKAWEAVSPNGEQLMMGCVLVQKDFADNHKDEFNAFLESYKQSITYTNESPAEAAALMEKFGVLPKQALAQKAIPLCNIVYEDAMDVKSSLDAYYEVLFSFEPKAVGGKLPDENFYYQK